MIEPSINLLAVVVSGVIYMIVGMLWYGPLFGKQWMKLIGMDPKHMESMKKGMGMTYGASFLSALVMAYVLAHFISYSGAITAAEGMQVGFWGWLGFVATSMLSGYLYAVKPKPWMLYVIDSGYYLVSLTLIGGLLAVWV